MKHALMKRSYGFHALAEPYIKEGKKVVIITWVYLLLLFITHILMGISEVLTVYIRQTKDEKQKDVKDLRKDL